MASSPTLIPSAEMIAIKEYLDLKEQLLEIRGRLMTTSYAPLVASDFKTKTRSKGVTKTKTNKKTKKVEDPTSKEPKSAEKDKEHGSDEHSDD
jgi:hypothetical protein